MFPNLFPCVYLAVENDHFQLKHLNVRIASASRFKAVLTISALPQKEEIMPL